MDERYDVVIVGAGHAGAQLALALRQLKHPGTILMIGEEPELPYERPPLSKDYLSGEKPWDKMLIRSAEAWAERGVAMRLGQPVTAVDPQASSVTTADGATIGYGTLVWATGGAPRRLTCDGGRAAGVHAIRTRADVDRLMAELPTARQAIVIGGGYIGLEAAAVLRKAGKPVILLEAAERVLARVAGAALSRFFEAEHRAHGVDVRTGVTVDCILEEGGRVAGVRLADGDVLPADIAIVGIGIEPAVAPLLAAGAEGGNGVRVDGSCRTSLPRVFAIGDCAEHRNPYAAAPWVRLESVQNAHDQARVAARAIIGEAADYDVVPWFWSNQYDLRLQTVGLSAGHDEAVTRGNPASRSFSVVYLRGGQVIALDCVNAVRDYTQGKLLIQARSRPSRDEIAAPAIPLKSLV